MKLIKELTIGETKIRVFQPEMTIAEEQKELEKIYNTKNKLRIQLNQRGIDISDEFYTEKQFKRILKDPNYIGL